MNRNSILNRIALVALAISGYFMGVIPEGALFSEITLTANQWLGLVGVVIGAWMSPSLNNAAVKGTANVTKKVLGSG